MFHSDRFTLSRRCFRGTRCDTLCPADERHAFSPVGPTPRAPTSQSASVQAYPHVEIGRNVLLGSRQVETRDGREWRSRPGDELISSVARWGIVDDLRLAVATIGSVWSAGLMVKPHPRAEQASPPGGSPLRAGLPRALFWEGISARSDPPSRKVPLSAEPQAANG